MKIETFLTNRQIRDYYRKFYSNRCAAYIADMLIHGEPESVGAMEHLARNGDRPSEKALKCLAQVQSAGVLRLNVAVLNSLESGADENSHDSHSEDWDDELSALKLCNPQEHARVIEELLRAQDSWWQTEGKYEDEIESRGESKYYYYEKDKAEERGVDYGPRDYLAGLDCFSTMT